jgi:hypothetical protein
MVTKKSESRSRSLTKIVLKTGSVMHCCSNHRGSPALPLFFLGGSSLSRLCMPDRAIVFQQLSCILKKHYCIRRLGACSTTAFASEPPGAGKGKGTGLYPPPALPRSGPTKLLGTLSYRPSPLPLSLEGRGNKGEGAYLSKRPLGATVRCLRPKAEFAGRADVALDGSPI